MNAIVVTAVLSCLNSGIYTGSRMLFALARRGDAPKGLLEVNRRGVPVRAILLTVSIGFFSVILAAIWPESVFLWLVNSSGAVALFCYVLIALAELRMRRRLEREAPDKLTLRMWGFPWLTYLTIAGMVVRDPGHGARAGRARAAVVEPRVARRRARRGVVEVPARGRARVVGGGRTGAGRDVALGAERSRYAAPSATKSASASSRSGSSRPPSSARSCATAWSGVTGGR